MSAKSKSKSKSKDTSGKDKSGKSKDKGSKSKSKLSAAAQALLGEKVRERAGSVGKNCDNVFTRAVPLAPAATERSAGGCAGNVAEHFVVRL